MMGWGWMPFGGLSPLLLLVVVLFVVALQLARSGGGAGQAKPPSQVAALDVLNERYARGEIGRDEYLQKKGDIGGAPPSPGGAP